VAAVKKKRWGSRDRQDDGGGICEPGDRTLGNHPRETEKRQIPFQTGTQGTDTKGRTSKMRKLGIPVVMDRIASQSVNLVFGGIFDPGFTESSFGFRRGRSQHMAIRHVQDKVREGYEWCASIDLKSFF